MPNVYEIDPGSIPGEVFDFPGPGKLAFNLAERTAGRSGLGNGVRELRGQLAQVRTKDGGAIPWTVTWGSGGVMTTAGAQLFSPAIMVDNPLALPAHGAAYLQLDWGVRSSKHTAFVDWGGGGQVQVVGTYVQSTVVLPNRIAEGGYINPSVTTGICYEPMSYFSSIVPGACGIRGPVYKTAILGSILVQGFAACPVPPFARRVMVTAWQSGAAALSQFDVSLWNGGNIVAGANPQVIARYLTQAVAFQSRDITRMFWYPVPIDACYASVELPVAGQVNQNNVQLIFELGL